MSTVCMHYLQFGVKPMPNAPAGTAKVPETTTDQLPAETTTVPEDITTFYDKMDKEDEDEEEEQELKTVSFEVNQVRMFTVYWQNVFNKNSRTFTISSIAGKN